VKRELWRHGFEPGVTVLVTRRVTGHEPPTGPPTGRVLASAIVAPQPHPTVIPEIADAREPVTATAYPGEAAITQPLWISGQVGGEWRHITTFAKLTLEQRRG
jgi:hypothetical protein